MSVGIPSSLNYIPQTNKNKLSTSLTIKQVHKAIKDKILELCNEHKEKAESQNSIPIVSIWFHGILSLSMRLRNKG